MSVRNFRFLSSSSSAQPQSQPHASRQSPHRALELDYVLVEIFSHVRSPHDLLQYRLVCQKWNVTVVHTLVKKRKNCFPLRLRYGDRQLTLLQRDAVRLTREILESPTMTLTGTTIPLSFDTVVVDCDFYLAPVNLQWQHFLSIYGESIRHLKFSIRSGEKPEENFRPVVDRAQVVSTQNLRAAFSAVPNLESLDFCVRFTHYKTHESTYGGVRRMFPGVRTVSDLPQMARLTKITIQEPHGVQYQRNFLIEILGMAPNLTTLYIKYTRDLSEFASALRALHYFDNSLTTLGITMADRSGKFDIHESGFSRFHLTKLELNCISGNVRHLEEFLQSQCSTLIALTLGDRVTFEPVSYHRCCGGIYPFGGHVCNTLYGNPTETSHVFGYQRGTLTCQSSLGNPLSLPPRMSSLKILELNLSKFKVQPITNYPNQFPALEELMLSNCAETVGIWSYHELDHVIGEEIGQSNSVKKFCLFGRMPGGEERYNITEAAKTTFPFARIYFGL